MKKTQSLLTKDAPRTEQVQRELALVAKAQGGDESSFEVLVNMYRSRLRNVIRKMLGHPEDTDDLYQETLIKASLGIKSFKGDASFGTWLCAIGVNLCLDFLRKQKQWRVRAQVIYGNQCYETPELEAEVLSSMGSVEFEYDVHEHIAYCWSCVARSLPPEQNAALVYREFLGLGNRESAKKMRLSESVFRHKLADARKTMKENFEGLCALVNKKGVCYQCSGLREGCASERRGAPVPAALAMEERVKIVAQAELDCGKSQGMHDLFYRRTKDMECAGVGRADEDSKCYTK